MQFELFFRDFCLGPRHDGLPEACQHGRVDPIGFGEDSAGFGEVADLSGVDDRNLMARVDQFGDEGPLVTAGRFHDDQTLSGRRKLLSELPSALGIVWRLERRSLRQHVHVEGPFGDVDTDEGFEGDVHDDVPSLRMRARAATGATTALTAVRADLMRPAAIQLSHGLLGPEGGRSTAGRCGKPCFATLRKPSHSCHHQMRRLIFFQHTRAG